jgi:hypothetical protein
MGDQTILHFIILIPTKCVILWISKNAVGNFVYNMIEYSAVAFYARKHSWKRHIIQETISRRNVRNKGDFWDSGFALFQTWSIKWDIIKIFLYHIISKFA